MKNILWESKAKRIICGRSQNTKSTGRPNHSGKMAVLYVLLGSAWCSQVWASGPRWTFWWPMLATTIGRTELLDESKTSKASKRIRQTDCSWWQCSGPPDEGGLRNVFVFQLEVACSCSVLTNPGPNDYGLFASMGHGLSKQRFFSFEIVKK